MHTNFSTGKTIELKTMKQSQKILVGLIFTIIGIAILCFASASIKTYNEKNATFTETTSKVVDYKYDDDGLQAIIVEYVVNGRTYQKVSNSYSNMPKSIGTKVSIKYNPNDPQDAIWTSDSANIILPIVGIVVTLIGVAILIYGIISGKKKKNIEEKTVEQTNGLYSNIDIEKSTQLANNTSQQMNSFNQTNSSVDTNNQNNNNINTNM